MSIRCLCMWAAGVLKRIAEAEGNSEQWYTFITTYTRIHRHRSYFCGDHTSFCFPSTASRGNAPVPPVCSSALGEMGSHALLSSPLPALSPNHAVPSLTPGFSALGLPVSGPDLKLGPGKPPWPDRHKRRSVCVFVCMCVHHGPERK